MATIFFFLFIISFLAAILCGLWAFNTWQKHKQYSSVDDYLNQQRHEIDKYKANVEAMAASNNQKIQEHHAEIIADKQRFEEEQAVAKNNLKLAKERLESDRKAILSAQQDKLKNAEYELLAKQKMNEAQFEEKLKKFNQDKAQIKQALPKIRAKIDAEKLTLTETQNEVVETKAQLASIRAASGGTIELADLQIRIRKARAELSNAITSVEMESVGVFDRLFDHDDPEQYRNQIKLQIDHRKQMVKYGTACTCQRQWQIGGSVEEGKKMTDRAIKLMLRAFNGECSAAIAKVSAKNYTTQKNKIQKTYDALNKLGETQTISITQEYLDCWQTELKLTYERDLVKREQKEREKEIKAQMREEARVEAEIAKAKQEAEKEEKAKEDALAKARAELKEIEAKNVADATKNVAKAAKENIKLQDLVSKLENELNDAIDRKSKAIARAQLTRSGHVYVLSNIGSFGPECYKIGMTRRLVPDERVKELGDASVPFQFDVHAMIYSEDAPALEKALHKYFQDFRVNRINIRKEYFNVSLDDIRKAVEELHGVITWVVEPAADEYRQTVKLCQSEEKPFRNLGNYEEEWALV